MLHEVWLSKDINCFIQKETYYHYEYESITSVHLSDNKVFRTRTDLLGIVLIFRPTCVSEVISPHYNDARNICTSLKV